MLQSKDTEWQTGLKNQEPTICCLRDSLQGERHRLKMRGSKKIFHANGNDKKVG